MSFNQPVGDLFYTVCYVSINDASWCLKNSSYFSSAYIMNFYLYRIVGNLRNLRLLYMGKPDKKFDFMAGPFLSLWRAILSLCTSTASIVYRQKLFDNAFYMWVMFAAITTFYSWLVDLKGDWGLLDYKSGNILRTKLIFPKAKPIYFIFAALDLAFRTAWILTISPVVVNSKGFSPFLFVMMISYTEIFRRGVWNILKV